MFGRRSIRTQFLVALGFSTLCSVGLFAYGAWHNHTDAFLYLLWNLFLAWIPVLITFRLLHVLSYKLWSAWESLLTTLVWLLFLPNSFYMISDFIHLQQVPSASVLYYSVVFTSFIYTGVALGFASLFLVHLQLKKRRHVGVCAAWIGLILLCCSVAMYIGRDLRWNSWDILTNPGGLIFDMSYRLIHPAQYPEVLAVIVPFFVLLVGMYALVWHSTRVVRASTRTMRS
jgi:uncharacterized membrane protein